VKALFEIEGITTISPSAMIVSPKNAKESHAQHDERCWRERMNVDDDGLVILPMLAMKKAIEGAAKMRSDTIPGKGKQTFTKHVASGILPDFDIPPHVLVEQGGKWKPIHRDAVMGVTRQVPSDGKVGGGKRVPRKFPEIPAPWRVQSALHVFADPLMEHSEKIREYLELAGRQIGLCRFRPSSQSAGWYGRFVVLSCEFVD